MIGDKILDSAAMEHFTASSKIEEVASKQRIKPIIIKKDTYQPPEPLHQVDSFPERFKNGLLAVGVLAQDLDDWAYAGGDHGRHLNYFNMLKRSTLSNSLDPDFENECVCGHGIKNNCFIYHKITKRIIVLGNCCIRRFMKNCGRTCEQCGEPHKRHTTNICKNCENLNEQKRIAYLSSIMAESPPRITNRYTCREPVIQTKEKVYIKVKYDNRDDAKQRGAMWDSNNKSWYAWVDNQACIEKFGVKQLKEKNELTFNPKVKTTNQIKIGFF